MHGSSRILPDRVSSSLSGKTRSWFSWPGLPYDTERPPQDVTALLGEPGHRWLTALGPYDGDSALLDVFLSSGMIFDSGEPEITTEQLEGASIWITWSSCEEGVLTYDIPSPGALGRNTHPAYRRRQCGSLRGSPSAVSQQYQPNNQSAPANSSHSACPPGITQVMAMSPSAPLSVSA